MNQFQPIPPGTTKAETQVELIAYYARIGLLEWSNASDRLLDGILKEPFREWMRHQYNQTADSLDKIIDSQVEIAPRLRFQRKLDEKNEPFAVCRDAVVDAIIDTIRGGWISNPED